MLEMRRSVLSLVSTGGHRVAECSSLPEALQIDSSGDEEKTGRRTKRSSVSTVILKPIGANPS